MKIISQILLLSLIFVISCDKDSVSSVEDSFSILGTWKRTQYNNGSGWTSYSSGEIHYYEFDSNGQYRFYGSGIEVLYYYQYCESSNVIHLGITTTNQSFTGDCNCVSPSNDYISYRFEREGLNTFFMLNCSSSSLGYELVRQ